MDEPGTEVRDRSRRDLQDAANAVSRTSIHVLSHYLFHESIHITIDNARGLIQLLSQRLAGVHLSYAKSFVVLVKDIAVLFDRSSLQINPTSKVSQVLRAIEYIDMFLTPVMDCIRFVADAYGYGGTITLEADRKSYNQPYKLYYNDTESDSATGMNSFKNVQNMRSCPQKAISSCCHRPD